ncbi:MAG: acetyl-CoA carboxylase carboxyltransferase subunit alpha [bacterium]|nr:acetyl-CoA carboxylase carboxyltransferase subunit alpha [bacterium]
MLDFEKPVLELEDKINKLKEGLKESTDVSPKDKKELKILEKKLIQTRRTIFKNLTPWQRVQLARRPNRPYFTDYVKMLFTDFIELHGDRAFHDDAAIIGGFARFNDIPVMILGQQKGRTVEENIKHNFGMMNPEGYRKALRLMKLAEKFNKPILTFIDTTGAYPGIGAEERGQGEAIARNLLEMSLLTVPVISTVLGEGGSGGALAIGVANAVLMLENAVYSVISPEGCASILWNDSTKAPDAAASMKMTAKDLYEFGLIDRIIPEPLGGAHTDYSVIGNNVKHALLIYCKKYMKMRRKNLSLNRYEKYRKMGEFIEKNKVITSKIK